MIKKIRNKFIIISMSSMLMVLVLILGVINIVNYRSVRNNNDQLLEFLNNNNGAFPRPDKKSGNPKILSPETPFETRYFSALLNEDGNVLWINSGNIAAITREDAVMYAKQVQSKARQKGYLGIYRYLKTEQIDGMILISFIDCARQLMTAKSFLIASVLIAVIGSVFVFLLVLAISNIAIRPIIKSYEKQKEFITNSGHELKTPLGIILSNTEVIEMETGESEWILAIKSQVGRMDKLIKNLTSLARLEEDREMVKTEFNLTDALIDTIEPFHILAQQKQIKVEEEISEGILYTGNEKDIRELFSILMDNAVKYAKDKITVSLKKQHNKRIITFQNYSAVPINLQDNKYFDRFYRGDESHSNQSSGYGIGLSIAKSIVEAHKGSITLLRTTPEVFTIQVTL